MSSAYTTMYQIYNRIRKPTAAPVECSGFKKRYWAASSLRYFCQSTSGIPSAAMACSIFIPVDSIRFFSSKRRSSLRPFWMPFSSTLWLKLHMADTSLSNSRVITALF